MTTTIPLYLRSNVGSSPAGCEAGNYCFGKGYENNRGENGNLALLYPVLGDGARLRVRQTNTARTSWRVTIQDSVVGQTSVVYSQFQGDWLEVGVLGTATSITLEALCFYY